MRNVIPFPFSFPSLHPFLKHQQLLPKALGLQLNDNTEATRVNQVVNRVNRVH